MANTGGRSRGVVPRGEALRRAVAWLAEQPVKDYATVEAAAMRFDLSPQDQEFLLSHFVQKKPSAE
ncbi:MAG: hypothetical protein PVI37_05225 [Gammaproteobacteria bacterium]|jgi:hypothetical protein